MSQITNDFTLGTITITQSYNISSGASASDATPYFYKPDDEYIISLNEKGNGMYAAALNNLILFLERDQIIPSPKKIIPFKEISAGFKTALEESGFITSKN